MKIETDVFNVLYLLLQVLVWVAMVATFLIYAAQLRAMRRGATGQNILALVQFLQEPTVRDARTIVRQRLRGKPRTGWSVEERRAADMVCSTYDVAAVLIFQEKLVPAEPFVKNWGASIRDCFEILHDHVNDMQRPENSGPEYWDDFAQLYEAAVRR